MNQYDNNYPGYEGQAPALSGSLAKTFLQKVFSIMSLGLLITGVVAWIFASRMMENPELVYTIFGSPLRWVIMLAPLGFIIAFCD